MVGGRFTVVCAARFEEGRLSGAGRFAFVRSSNASLESRHWNAPARRQPELRRQRSERSGHPCPRLISWV